MARTIRAAPHHRPKAAYGTADPKLALKNAALQLVLERGPRAFSLIDASRLARVGAPYHHFEGKDALLAELACDGIDLMIEELNEAVSRSVGLKEKLLAVGMTYLRFSKVHEAYFAVIFHAGLDKTRYSEVARKGQQAFDLILGLAQGLEDTSGLANQRAIACWALVHGLATASKEGVLSAAMQEKVDLAHIQPLLEDFLRQPSR
jgi:AcrR family transcriptional regulator